MTQDDGINWNGWLSAKKSKPSFNDSSFRQGKIVLLDFNTIIDPVSLLTSLVIFRQSHDHLCVRGESMVYQYDYEDHSHPGMNFGRFDDKDALTKAPYICSRSSDDLEFHPSNLCLSIRLLQHALNEGIVTILDDHLLGEWYGAGKRLSADEIRCLPSFEYIDKHIFSGAKYGKIILSTDTPGQQYFDVGMSLKQGWDVSIGGRTFDYRELIVQASVSEKNLGQHKEYIRVLSADKFRVYTSLIDEPSILNEISAATKVVVKNQKFESELRWFLPKYALGSATLGVYPLLEMLWLIVKRNLGKPSNNKE